MKNLIFSLSVVCLLAFAGQSQAFGFGVGRALIVQPAVVAAPVVVQQQAFVPLAQVGGHVGVVQAAPVLVQRQAVVVQRAPVVVTPVRAQRVVVRIR